MSRFSLQLLALLLVAAPLLLAQDDSDREAARALRSAADSMSQLAQVAEESDASCAREFSVYFGCQASKLESGSKNACSKPSCSFGNPALAEVLTQVDEDDKRAAAQQQTAQPAEQPTQSNPNHIIGGNTGNAPNGQAITGSGQDPQHRYDGKPDPGMTLKCGDNVAPGPNGAHIIADCAPGGNGNNSGKDSPSGGNGPDGGYDYRKSLVFANPVPQCLHQSTRGHGSDAQGYVTNSCAFKIRVIYWSKAGGWFETSVAAGQTTSTAIYADEKGNFPPTEWYTCPDPYGAVDPATGRYLTKNQNYTCAKSKYE